MLLVPRPQLWCCQNSPSTGYTDADGDGALDCMDACPNDSSKWVNAGTCGCGAAETDSDGDGALDFCATTTQPRDECVSDASKVAPGTCGCGVADADSDGDHVLDCEDGCPLDADKYKPGTCGCGVVCATDTAPTCSDRKHNGDESDVDCGANCAKCVEGMLCGSSDDCAGTSVCGVVAGDNLCVTADTTAREAGTYIAVSLTLTGSLTHEQFRDSLLAAFIKWFATFAGVAEELVVVTRVRTTNSIAVDVSIRATATADPVAIAGRVTAALAPNASNTGARSPLANALVEGDASLATSCVYAAAAAVGVGGGCAGGAASWRVWLGVANGARRASGGGGSLAIVCMVASVSVQPCPRVSTVLTHAYCTRCNTGDTAHTRRDVPTASSAHGRTKWRSKTARLSPCNWYSPQATPPCSRSGRGRRLASRPWPSCARRWGAAATSPSVGPGARRCRACLRASRRGRRPTPRLKTRTPA